MIRMLVMMAAILFAIAWLLTSEGCADPALHAYGAERMLCVQRYPPDAAAEARECIRKVDEKYGQDGGVK